MRLSFARRRPLRQDGDTIVEVLMSIAIVSVVLVGAYASSNRNVHITQDTQERSQALQLIQGQAELLRAAGKLDTATKQCFDSASGNPAAAAGCHLTPNGAGTQPDYTVTITAPSANVYLITATWPSLVTGGTNNTSIYYQP